jgi:hydrogenase maturation protease
MSKVLVIGYGNPFRADDGIGFRAAEQFEAENPDHASIEVVASQQLKPEMIEAVSRVDLVIFIDANSNGVPGTVCSRQIGPIDIPEGIFSHSLTPGSVLTAAKLIYRRCPQAVMISVTGKSFGFSSNLTPEATAALPQVSQRIREVIASSHAREGHRPAAEQAGG